MQGLRAVLWPSGCRWEPVWDGFLWSIVDGVPVRVHCATLGHLLLKLLLPMPLSCVRVCVTCSRHMHLIPGPVFQEHSSELPLSIQSRGCVSREVKVRPHTHLDVQVSNKE